MSPFQHFIRQPILYVNKRFSECKSKYFIKIQKQNTQFFQAQILKHCLSSPFKVWNSYYTFFFFKLFGWHYYIQKHKDKCSMLLYYLKSSRHSTMSRYDVRCYKVSHSTAFVKKLLHARPTPRIPGLREIKMLPKTLPSWRCYKCLVCPQGKRD